MGGLLATSFALGADTPQPSPVYPPLHSLDILPKTGAAPTSMVVLLHGFGANGQSLRWWADAWAAVLPNAVFVLPDAPQQCRDNTDPQSRQWFATRALDPDAAQRAVEIRGTAPVLNHFIDTKLAQYNLKDRHLVMAGISQGAMMALHAAPRRGRPCSAVVAYNGMLADPAGLRHDRLVRMPIFAGHGRQDNVVPYRHLAEAAQAFRGEGFKVETASYNLGHSVDAAGLRQGAAFAQRHLANAAASRQRRWFFGL